MLNEKEKVTFSFGFWFSVIVGCAPGEPSP